MKGKVKVGKLNVDLNPVTRLKFDISAAPTFILYLQGKETGRLTGVRSKKQLLKFIDSTSKVVTPAVPGRAVVEIPTAGKQSEKLEEVKR